MKIRFYGLLHLAEAENSAVNLAVRDFGDQVSVYLKCALTLSSTLSHFGETFTLLTNRRQQLLDRLDAMSMTLDVEEIDFATAAPVGMKFYSTYFKIDCHRYFSGLDRVAACLIDLDCICLCAMPLALQRNIDQGFAIAYDISDQVVPLWTRDSICSALGLLNGLQSEGRWYGGEFICGSPDFYRRLVESIDELYPRYLEHIADPEGPINSSGEEPIVSAALEILKSRGVHVADAGTIGIIGRYWSEETRHYQRPLEYFLSSSFLHLPSDKRILAAMADDVPFGPASFMEQYRRLNVRPPLASRVAAKLPRPVVDAAKRMLGREPNKAQ